MSHDYDWKAKHEKDRQHWPTGSLERTLVRQGARSLAEAVKKKMKDQKDSPPEVPFEEFLKEDIEPPESVAMRNAIKEIEELSKDFDFTTVPKETVDQLAIMSVSTIEEVASWLNAWKKVLVKPYAW